jgi:putative ABC transport system permease protein
LLGGGHPDRWETILGEQRQQQSCIPPIMFLLPRLRFADLLGMAPVVFNNLVSPGYFATMRMPLLEGRDFSDGDNKDAPQAAIINRAMAEKFWPKEDAIGKRFARKGREQKPITVVGIVQDAKYKGLPRRRSRFSMFHSSSRTWRFARSR